MERCVRDIKDIPGLRTMLGDEVWNSITGESILNGLTGLIFSLDLTAPRPMTLLMLFQRQGGVGGSDGVFIKIV